MIIKKMVELSSSEEWLSEPFDKVRAKLDLIAIQHNSEDGDIKWSATMFADRWGWSISKVHRFKRDLVSAGFLSIASKSSNQHDYTVVYISDTAGDTAGDIAAVSVSDCTGRVYQGGLDLGDTARDTARDTADTPQVFKDLKVLKTKPFKDSNTRTLGNPEKKRKVFRPPSVDDVRAYCQERNNSVDPEAWVDHYTSNGWKVGKNSMKDWKAAVRTWERNRGGFSQDQQKPTRPKSAQELLAEQERGRR